jgi:hypothetical protein
MARKSLRPYLNQIRAWTRQGRTDAWVAHQLEVSVQEVAEFKRQNKLAADDAAGAVATSDEEIDLRAADEALIAAELEAAQLEAEQLEAEQLEAAGAEESEDEEAEGEEPPRARRRSRRGGAGRRSGARRRAPIEATFDHGDEGYGLWLDPAVRDDPIYAEHWAGHRPIEVTIEEDQIVIRRIGEDEREAAGEDEGERAA